jgi:formylmethanofuran dehydrogenase subunit E-like metal-binding protein
MIRKIGVLVVCCMISGLVAGQALAVCPNYLEARDLGRYVAGQAASALDKDWKAGECIVLSNAGYVRPDGGSTQGCLDGVAEITGASVGQSTLISLQSRFDQPLWFAFYDRSSGRCAYYELQAELAGKALTGDETLNEKLFSRTDVARIDAETLFAEPEAFKARCRKGLFGQNLFRVVTVANAADRDCPNQALKAMQVHDHYCPGVTSGIMLAGFVQEHILKGSSQAECFVLSIDPWCKEDALATLLNATPGKRAYGVVYPEEGEVKTWPKPMNKVSTAVFVRKEADKAWQGWLLSFDFDKARSMQDQPSFGFPVLDKLALDLWFLDKLDSLETFVSVVKEVELEQGVSPKTLLQPGSDPVTLLGEL